MSDIDELKRLSKNSKKLREGILRDVKEIADSMPRLEGEKRVGDLVDRILNELPEDHLAENAPHLLQLMQYDYFKLGQASIALNSVKRNLIPDFTSGSMLTASVYEVTTYVLNNSPAKQGQVDVRLEPLKQEITALAEEKQREQSLRGFLDKVHPDLAKDFSEALDSAVKAQIDLVGVDQALIRLRDVLEHLWGHLKNYAKERCKTVNWHNANFGSEPDRKELADCLSKSDSAKVLWIALNELRQLFSDLSLDSKNILKQDKIQLDQFKTRWLLQLERLEGLIDL